MKKEVEDSISIADFTPSCKNGNNTKPMWEANRSGLLFAFHNQSLSKVIRTLGLKTLDA
jgi:hypothetical protein